METSWEYYKWWTIVSNIFQENFNEISPVSKMRLKIFSEVCLGKLNYIWGGCSKWILIIPGLTSIFGARHGWTPGSQKIQGCLRIIFRIYAPKGLWPCSLLNFAKIMLFLLVLYLFKLSYLILRLSATQSKPHSSIPSEKFGMPLRI